MSILMQASELKSESASLQFTDLNKQTLLLKVFTVRPKYNTIEQTECLIEQILGLHHNF